MNKSVDLKKLSFFAALCFFLSAVETAIPKPVPFFRLGLANLPVLLSLAYMTRKETAFLIVLKVFLQGIVSGTLFSYVFLFSLAGSFASGFGMMFLYSVIEWISGASVHKAKWISWIGVSMWGGLLNNLAQLICAYFLMFGKSTRLIAPVLLVISFVTSFILGLVAILFEEKSEWLKVLKYGNGGEFGVEAECESVPATERDAQVNAPRDGAPAKRPTAAPEGRGGCGGPKSGTPDWAPKLFLILALTGILFVSFINNLFVVICLLVVSALIVFFKKRRLRLFPSLVIIFSVTALSLLSPYGKILCTLGRGNLKITWGAMENGLLRSCKLCTMVFMSQWAVDKNLNLPGKAGIFMGRIFQIVSKLTEEKMNMEKKESWKNFFIYFLSEIDRKILNVWNLEEMDGKK